MLKLTAEAIAEMVALTEEMLADAGFTGVKIASTTALPDATVKALGEDEDIRTGDPGFAEEIGYHRVTTDQGTFGIWYLPYVTLDLSGLGLDIMAFLPPGTPTDDIPDDWAFIGLGEGVPETLFAELTKKSRQP